MKLRKALYRSEKRRFEQRAVSNIFGVFNDAAEEIVAQHFVER
jgi:hypothetical protein